MRNFLNKHKFIRVIKFNKDKSSTISYYKREKLPANILINPDHIFLANGYSTIVTTSESAETINPLDFNSKYDVKKFKTAIDSKLIDETFRALKTPKFELTQIILFLLLLFSFVNLYFSLKANGVF